MSRKQHKKKYRVFAKYKGYSYNVDDIVELTEVSVKGAYWRIAAFRKGRINGKKLLRKSNRWKGKITADGLDLVLYRRQKRSNELYEATLNDDRIRKACN